MTPVSLYSFFIERVREHLHFALAFSPIGDSFKRRLQIYPSLVNYCTMDWFSAWPNDALQHVAKKFIIAMNLSSRLRGEGVLDASEPKSSTDMPPAEDEDTENLCSIALTPLEGSLVDMVLYFNQSVRTSSKR